MNKLKLNAAKRTLVGKAVKKLRVQGKLPANLYGNKVKSQAVELSYDEFKKLYRKAGETKIVELSIAGEQVRPVLIHRVQVQPVSGLVVHADFYQVNLKEKIRTKVPVELSGECPAVVQKLGLLLQTLNDIEIEALPTDLPEKLSATITGLKEVGNELKVSDLNTPSGVTILTDHDIVIAKIGELVSKETEQLAAEEAAKAEAAKAEAQTATAAPATTTGETSTETSAGKTPATTPQSGAK